ncbi:hypothetical protein CLOM_g10295 [Closterium sp. NIES-68]|nr:hypothetical protein CLOM_g10295 [Closterium sp. NIES-68]GJP78140.1 hypothetical protein CLOP_g8473 [Closterium sp. NIES-67]
MADVKCLHPSVSPVRLSGTASSFPEMTLPSDTGFTEFIPPEFLCPLSGDIMRDPVIAPWGQSYDRLGIKHFLAQGGCLCPKTGRPLTDCALIPNDALRQLIAAWCDAHAMPVPSPPPPPPPLIAASPLAASQAVLPVRSAPVVVSALASPPHRSPCSPLPSPSPLQRRHSLQPNRISSARGGHGEESLASPAASANGVVPWHMGRTGSSRSLCRTMSPLSETASLHWTAASSAAASPSAAHLASPHRHNHQLAATSADDAADAALSSYLSSSAALAHRQLQCANSPHGTRRRSKDAPVCEMRPLVDALQNADVAVRRDAAHAIHVAVKEAAENRMRLVQAGGVAPLLGVVRCEEHSTAERACAALLYLCVAGEAAREVVAGGGIHVLVDVLRAAGEADRQGGASEATMANAAAALFTLSSTKEERRRLVCSAGAVPHLVRLLETAETARAQKDSCLALYGLVTVRQAAEQAVVLGVVPLAVALLERQSEGVEEKAASLLAALARSKVGVEAIGADDDALCTLVDVMEGSSELAAGKAASTLLALARHGGDAMVSRIMAEGCLPPLAKLAARSKAGSDSRALLEVLRNVSQSRK